MGYRAVAYIKPSGRPIRTLAFNTQSEAEMDRPDSLAARLSINIPARL